ncbi:MAG: hypothetical protein CSA25_04190 [Desulfobacter postgatei]|uniref:Radical SAM protein n=1 Tax=Desulfobacter postgatei TaxID=2293 RepID=A0A2G6MRE9_9BACT|nr:MAG: hypothetical protein CSA25_04190 [Desulfobacter postgatei]
MGIDAKPRQNMHDRVDLCQALPLSQPIYITVDPSFLCNIKCVFCGGTFIRANDPHTLKNGIMPYETFTHIIDSLAEFSKPLKSIRLYNHGEPLVNPDFARMVKYAVDSGYVEGVMTVSNGLLFTQERSKEILDAGINEIMISVNGLSDEQFYLMTKTKVNFKKYYENLKFLYSIKGDCVLRLKFVNELFANDDEKKRCIEIFGEICDALIFESLYEWSGLDAPRNTPENIQAIKMACECNNKLDFPHFTPDHNIARAEVFYRDLGNGSDKLVCPRIFYSLAINADGSVSICCGDGYHQLLCGDVNKNTIKEIWNSTKLKSYQIAHLKGKRRNMKHCRDCRGLKYFVIDNIDDCREGILERINNQRK